jgi:hypothetical protein
MPSILKLARLATLPETRSLIVAVARSETARDIARRARSDRAALVRDLGNPANARDLVRSAATHPATRELATAGLIFLPGRYVPLGWVATWAARKAIRRYVDPPAEVVDAQPFGRPRDVKNVTPDEQPPPDVPHAPPDVP